MRLQGRIVKWDDERGFGFISPAEGGGSVFVHISSFPGSKRRPGVNEAVSYTVGLDSHGRPQARDVRFVVGSPGASPTRRSPRAGVAVPIAFSVSFFVVLVALVAAGQLEMIWLAFYYSVSLITFGVYARDKKVAQSGGWRIRESTLHLLSLVGGWPGALLAQTLLRHKTRKPSFLFGYWFTVAVNCIALGVIVVKEVSLVKMLFGAAS